MDYMEIVGTKNMDVIVVTKGTQEVRTLKRPIKQTFTNEEMLKKWKEKNEGTSRNNLR